MKTQIRPQKWFSSRLEFQTIRNCSAHFNNSDLFTLHELLSHLFFNFIHLIALRKHLKVMRFQVKSFPKSTLVSHQIKKCCYFLMTRHRCFRLNINASDKCCSSYLQKTSWFVSEIHFKRTSLSYALSLWMNERFFFVYLWVEVSAKFDNYAR